MNGFTLTTRNRTEFVDITRQVAEAVNASGMGDGIVTVFVPHTTAGVTINENADPDVLTDLNNALEKQVPWSLNYRHSEGNAAAHVKVSMLGSSVQVIVEKGALQLGSWQGIFFCECPMEK